MSIAESISKTRVAVYVRIGGRGEYALQFEMHKSYYEDLFKQSPEWELVEIYADLGVAGYGQPNLKRLLSDCKAGKIDQIVTKSVSRISRSVAKAIRIVRDLGFLAKPVGVYFENENINTSNRFYLTLLCVCEEMAKEESRRKHEHMPFSDELKHFQIFNKGADK